MHRAAVTVLTALVLGLRAAAVRGVGAGHHGHDDLLVHTGSMVLQGTLEENMTNVRVFCGVPFVEPPLGTHRFKAPVTKKPETSLVGAT
jgi:Carboxylesterase family